MIDYSCDCPIEAILKVIGGKWKWLIYRELFIKGTARFGELQKGIHRISPKVLAGTLKDMENDGIISKTIYAEIPPHTEYALTAAGYSLQPVFISMKEWGTQFLKHEVEFARKEIH